MENRITLSKRVEGKSRLWVTLLLLCFCSFTWAQVKVTGVVTDPSGEAIIGANIVEKGVPGNGTISDIDGNFTLNVKSNKANSARFINEMFCQLVGPDFTTCDFKYFRTIYKLL